jgi:hypothetical protein
MPFPNCPMLITNCTFSQKNFIFPLAGDKKVGGLNRLKITALPKKWLYQDLR